MCTMYVVVCGWHVVAYDIRHVVACRMWLAYNHIVCGWHVELDPETSVISCFRKVERKATGLLKTHVLWWDQRRYELKLSRTLIIVYMIMSVSVTCI